MKLKLTFTERFFLMRALPTEDTFMNLNIKNDVKEKIDITPEDEKEVDFKPHENGFKWNLEVDKAKEFDLSNSEVQYLKSKLNNLDQKAMLSEQLLEVYKQINK